MSLWDLVEKGRCVFVSCLKGPRTAEAHFKGCGKGVLFRADGYKSWRWLCLSINLLNSLFSGSPFYFVIMPHFVQKELEKSSVTKGFVRQQALKERGEKRARLFFLLLCCQGQQWLPLSPSLPDVCVLLSLEVGEQLPKYLGLPSCRLGWSHCPPPTEPLSLALLGAGSGDHSAARNPLLGSHSSCLLAFCWGFPLEVWNNCSPCYPPSLTSEQWVCFLFKVYFP